MGSEEARTLREKKVSDIHNRFAIIEDSGDCIFVSIHMNHFDSAYVCGAQTFYSGLLPDDLVDTRESKRIIINNLHAILDGEHAGGLFRKPGEYFCLSSI